MLIWIIGFDWYLMLVPYSHRNIVCSLRLSRDVKRNRHVVLTIRFRRVKRVYSCDSFLSFLFLFLLFLCPRFFPLLFFRFFPCWAFPAIWIGFESNAIKQDAVQRHHWHLHRTNVAVNTDNFLLLFLFLLLFIVFPHCYYYFFDCFNFFFPLPPPLFQFGFFSLVFEGRWGRFWVLFNGNV